jgi:hypothetical protein
MKLNLPGDVPQAKDCVLIKRAGVRQKIKKTTADRDADERRGQFVASVDSLSPP